VKLGPTGIGLRAVVFLSNPGIARLEVEQLQLLKYAVSVSTHEHACKVFASKAYCAHEWHSKLWS
jgi:hypothetical protein